MPDLYTGITLLNNQSEKNGESNLKISVFGSKGGPNEYKVKLVCFSIFVFAFRVVLDKLYK